MNKEQLITNKEQGMLNTEGTTSILYQAPSIQYHLFALISSNNAAIAFTFSGY